MATNIDITETLKTGAAGALLLWVTGPQQGSALLPKILLSTVSSMAAGVAVESLAGHLGIKNKTLSIAAGALLGTALTNRMQLKSQSPVPTVIVVPQAPLTTPTPISSGLGRLQGSAGASSEYLASKSRLEGMPVWGIR